jgi:hypothetical protein
MFLIDDDMKNRAELNYQTLVRVLNTVIFSGVEENTETKHVFVAILFVFYF